MSAQHGSRDTTRAFRRTLRQALDTSLPLLGVVMILSTVLFVRELRSQLALVVLGILCLEVGVWKLAHHILPNERTYLALRCEVDLFLSLVRQLNTAALLVQRHDTPAHRQTFEEVRSAMQQTVDRIFEVAGQTEADLASVHDVRRELGARPSQGAASDPVLPE